MRTIELGHTRIDKVTEMALLWMEPGWLYPAYEPWMAARHADALGPTLIDPVSGKLALSFHSYVIRTPQRTILVDTCNGNDKPRLPNMAWQHMLKSQDYLSNLAALGLGPEDIDIVLCTHLHSDHVGWNTRLVDGRWTPTFPNARYVFSRTEFEHWSQVLAGRPGHRVGHGSFQDSVLPVVEAGQVDLVAPGHTVTTYLDERVWLEPAPGHTAGHVSVHVQGQRGKAILSGDIIHHPIAFHEPGLYSVADFDRAQAAQTRRSLFEHCVDSNAVLLPGHFPAPSAGHVLCCSHGGFRFRFLDTAR